MKKIDVEVGKVPELENKLKIILPAFFLLPKVNSDAFITERLQPYINNLKDNLSYLIEWPYVDRVFRDSYYNYFSSKNSHNEKNCIRISFFEQDLNYDQFRNKELIAGLRKSFRGFIILRPTPPFIVGRNLISPHALKSNSFESCFVEMPVTVNSVKMNVRGFPHSSQDTETITCAETTLWSCMEYFGLKYPEYKPVLPSQIIKVLSQTAYERQLPSSGLNSMQISSALKEFGFGSKIYWAGEYTSQRFSVLFSSYIESGIPIIIGLNKCLGEHNGTLLWDSGSPGHAVLGIGRESISNDQIEACNLSIPLNDGRQIIDLDGIEKKYVIIDDNHPPYQLANFSEPCKYYNNTEWDKSKIAFFIVPLHNRVYLEAYEAKRFVYDLLDVNHPLPANETVALRFYLTSTRSYKHWVASHSDLPDDLREIILRTSMAKFIWIAETGTKDTFKQKKANGLVLIDATSANTHDLKPLIFSAHHNVFVSFHPENKRRIEINLPLGEFNIYQNNLKQLSHE